MSLFDSASVYYMSDSVVPVSMIMTILSDKCNIVSFRIILNAESYCLERVLLEF